MKHHIPSTILDFDTHLKNIEQAKSQANSILQVIAPGYLNAQSVIETAWEAVFDQLCNNESSLTISQLNTLAGIIQKLMSGLSQIKTMETKLNEHSMKEQIFENKKQEWQDILNQEKQKNNGISQETLEIIEAELKLL